MGGGSGVDGAPRRDSGRVDLWLLAQRFGVLLGGHAGAKGIALIAAILLGRSLGPQALGVYTTLVTVLSFGTVGINSGLDIVGTREIARSPDCAGGLVRRIAGYRLGAGVLGAVLAVALGPAFHIQARAVLPFALAMCAFAFRVDWALIALGRVGAVSIGQMVREISFVCAVGAIVIHRPSVAGAGYAFLIGEATWSLCLCVALWRSRAKPGEQAQPSIGWLLREATPVFLLSAMVLTYNKVDGPLLLLFRGSAEAGVYAASYTIFMAACAPGALLGRAVLPELARVRAGGPATAPGHAHVRPILTYTLVGGAACGAFVAIFAKPIMSSLYGHGFSGGAVALQYLVGAVPLHFGFSVVVQELMVDGQRRALIEAGLTGALVNVGANLALIPHLGMNGAAIATLLSEGAALISALRSVRLRDVALAALRSPTTPR